MIHLFTKNLKKRKKAAKITNNAQEPHISCMFQIYMCIFVKNKMYEKYEHYGSFLVGT